MAQDNKIKFVVAKPSYGNVYDYCYKELENRDNVDLLDSYITFKSKKEEKIYYKHFTPKMWLPFRSIWNKRYFNNKFDKNDEIYFILYSIPNGVYNYGIVKYLKRKYKNSKVILFLNDLVDKNYKTQKDKKVLNQFDAVLSFDYNDCKKYGFYNHPLVYSKPEKTENDNEDIDVYFCGKDKNRLDLIMKAFHYLKSKGLKCLFLIQGVPQEKRESIEGLEYLDKFMPYEQNLEYLKKSKCVLEIMQEGGNGYTLRTCEAVAYNKKIITNNKILKEAEFYNENMITFFDNVTDINISFIKEEKKSYFDNNYFSPVKLLDKVLYIFKKEVE